MGFAVTVETPSEKVDALLEQLSLMIYGQHYYDLSPLKADSVIAEAVRHFDAKQVELADSLS